jgi:hypothetical protein
MNKSEKSPRKTKKQLKKSGINSLLIALMIFAFPVFYVIDYRRLCLIFTGRTNIVTASGDEALLTIYGTVAAAAFAAMIAIYNAAKNLMRGRGARRSER